MTNYDVRSKIFEVAEDIALDKGMSRLQARDKAGDHLRYAALKIIEGKNDVYTPAKDRRFMLAYGIDKAQYEQWGDEVDWWGDGYPKTGAHRIRVIAKDGGNMVPEVAEVLEAIGATFVYHEQEQDPNKPPMSNGVNAYHFLMDSHTEDVEDYCTWLQNRHYSEVRQD